MWTVLFCFLMCIAVSVAMGLPGLMTDLKKMDEDEVNDWLCFFGFHSWKPWSDPSEYTDYKVFGGHTTHAQQRQCDNCNKHQSRRF